MLYLVNRNYFMTIDLESIKPVDKYRTESIVTLSRYLQLKRFAVHSNSLTIFTVTV